MGERRWAMRRVDHGDWICWSNDRAQLWRFHTHIDGRILGLVCDYDERTFWRAVYMPAARVETLTGLPEPWSEDWIEAAWHLPTRQAAIDVMLEHVPFGDQIAP